MVNEQRMRSRHCMWLVHCYIQCFNSAGWMRGRVKPVAEKEKRKPKELADLGSSYCNCDLVKIADNKGLAVNPGKFHRDCSSSS